MMQLPFGDKIVTMEITGEALIESLENGLATANQLDGRFCQISGFWYEYDSSKPAGQKVIRDSITMKHQQFDPEAKYTIATTTYCGRLGKDGFSMLTDPAKAKPINDEDTDRMMLDVLVAFFKTREHKYVPDSK